MKGRIDGWRGSKRKGMSIGYFVRKESKSATEDLIFMVWLLYLGKLEISAFR